TAKAEIETIRAQLEAVSRKPAAGREELAEAYGQMGKVYHAYGFSDAAAACYLDAHTLAPQAPAWPYYLGRLYQGNGEIKKAILYLNMARALRPDDTPTLVYLSEAYLADGQTGPAETGFKRAIALDNSLASAKAGLGEVALSKGEFTVAIRYLEEALKLQPDATSLHYPLAMAYRGAGDVTQAITQLRMRGSGAPKVPDPLMDDLEELKKGKMFLWKRGNQAMHEGRFADAVKAYGRMLALSKDDPLPRIYLGIALAEEGNLVGAEDQYQRVLRLAPDNATAHYNLGVILLQTGQYRQATDQFLAAAGFDPGFTLAHFQLANLLMRSGFYQDAIAHYTRVITLDPNNSFARLMKAMAFVRLKRYSEAEVELTESVAAFPESADFASALARLLAACPDKRLRDGPRALRLVEKLLQNNTSPDFDLAETYAMSLASVARFSEAARLQRRMIVAVESQKRYDLAALLRQNLVLYEHDQPCPVPWRDNDPIFTPQPGKMVFSAPNASRMAIETSSYP
ncbi:MAG: tetratricopeptide repeat protein, partial [Terriglobia bacterium]